MPRASHRLCLTLLLSSSAWLVACAATPARTTPISPASYRMVSHDAKPGHARPLVAIIGDNAGVELSDFLVPYSILSAAGTLEVVAVSLHPGPVATFTDMGQPSFRFVADMTVDELARRYPEGPDYVVVPAQATTPALVDWLAAQAKHGATLVSICNGALPVAATGLFAGRHATAHWSTAGERTKRYPDVRWTPDLRYIGDGNWISTTGVSAALPASIALIEAVSGQERAGAVAQSIGLADWAPSHDTASFRPHLRGTAWPLARVAYLNRWLHARDAVAVAAVDGMDEAGLALVVDTWSSTGRSRAYVTSRGAKAVRTRHGLLVLPDHGDEATGDSVLTDVPAGRVIDRALDGIMQRYGHATASGVALVFEYDGYPP